MSLETCLAHQLAYGCDCLLCKNRYCARCPEFLYPNRSKSELARIASHLLATHKDDPKLLCRYLPTLVQSPQVLENVTALNAWAERFMESDDPDIAEAIDMINRNFLLLPMLFLSNDMPLSFRNSAVDDKLFYDFTEKLTIVPEMSDAVNQLIVRLLDDVVKYDLFSFTKVRQLVLLMYFPGILPNPVVLNKVLAFLNQPPALVKYTLNQWFMFLPRCMKMAVGACQFALTDFFATHLRCDPRDKRVIAVLGSMELLFEANQLAMVRLPASSFYCHHVSESVDVIIEFQRNARNSLLQFPFVFPLKTKAELCQWESATMMEMMARRSIIQGLQRALLQGQRMEFNLFLTLHIRRSHLVEDAINELSRQAEWMFLKKLQVQFEGEVAVDVGGPSREFLYLVSGQLLSPEYGMFQMISDKYLWFVPSSFEDNTSFFLVGAVIGLAVYNSIVLPVRFPMCLYKKLLTPEKPLTLTDLAEIDEEVAHSLRDIERMKFNCEDVSSLCLNFAITLEQFDQQVTYRLIDNGENIEVTSENCEQYICEYIRFMLYTCIKRQFDAFCQGFRLSIRATSYSLLSPSELDILVSGDDIMDWRALKNNTQYQDGYTAESQAVVWFWDLFDSMSDADKKKFLKFSTGTDRAPYGGLGSVNLIIQRAASDNQLPVSHTCFNMFCLPDYSTKEELCAKVRLAIQYTEGFGLV